MKALKIFFVILIITPVVGVELYFNHREQQCIEYWQQQGYNSEQSQFICFDD